MILLKGASPIMSLAYQAGLHGSRAPSLEPRVLYAWHLGYYARSQRPAHRAVYPGTLSIPVDPTIGYRWGMEAVA